MPDSDTEKEDLLFEFKSVCHLHKQMLQDAAFQKFIKSLMFYVS